MSLIVFLSIESQCDNFGHLDAMGMVLFFTIAQYRLMEGIYFRVVLNFNALK